MVNKPQLQSDALWRQRFQSPYVFYSYVAPQNPVYGFVSGKIEGITFQLYAWNIETGDLRQLTNEPTGVYEGWLTPDASSLFFLKDEKGNELGHLIQVDYGSGEQRNVTPNLSPFTLRGFTICRSGNRLAFNAVNDDGYRYYYQDINDDHQLTEPQQIFSIKDETWDAVLSYGGDLLAVKSTARAGGKRNYSTLIFNMNGEQIAELWDGEESSVEPIMFSPVANDLRLLGTTLCSGFKRPLLWDVSDNERYDLPLEELLGDIQPIDWSADGQDLLLRQTHKAQTKLLLYDLDASQLHHLDHPEGAYGGMQGPCPGSYSMTYFAPTGDIWAHYSNSATPPQTIALDRESGAQKETIITLSTVPPGLPERSVSFTSSDGESVQGWLSLPGGEGSFPTIIEIHGGPHAHVGAGFAPFAQVWLDHGFANLSINYRGSTGFGHDFRNQIIGDIGHWELEDLAAARKWLIEQGIAKADEIILSGGSYGAFLVLLALSKQSALWRLGLAKVAMADWAINYEDCSEAIRGLSRNLFGGTPDEFPERYRAASPYQHAENIEAPLLIYQAENDSRTTSRQMELFVEKMEKLGKPLQIHWLGAGHSFGDIAMIEESITAELKFVYDVLGDE